MGHSWNQKESRINTRIAQHLLNRPGRYEANEQCGDFFTAWNTDVLKGTQARYKALQIVYVYK